MEPAICPASSDKISPKRLLVTITSKLEGLPIPASVTTIGSAAFRGCSALTEMNIPDKVTSIGNYAFTDCTGLESVSVSASVTSIGDCAFNGCTGLKTLRLEDGAKTLSLGYNTYNNSGTGKGTFYDCPLTSIYIGRNLSYAGFTTSYPYYYGYSPFANITTIKTVTVSVPNDLASFSINKYTFKGCSGITSGILSPTTTGYTSTNNANSDGTVVTDNLCDTSIAANLLKTTETNYLYWRDE